ncbi:sugar transporter [Clostridium nitritogenes]|uniref:Sugar transporter n=1 Tax=Clostridium nitritogenes TaxID=83340 RepID=A0ABN1LHI9_9CLOT
MLGADIAGLNSLYTSLIGLLNVAELGVGVAVGYSLYKPLSDKNFEKIKDIMILFKYYYKRIAIIIIFLGTILSIFLPWLIKGQIDIKLAYIYYFIYLLNCSTSYIFTYKQTLIIADQKQYKITSVLNITKIIKIILQCLVILILKSFLIWLILEFSFNLLGMILANRKIDLEYSEINYYCDKSIGLIKNENIMIGKNIRNVFFHKIGGFVVLQTDSILISIFSTLRETAIYANYMMIINAMVGLLNTAIGSIMPSIGNLIAEESREKSYSVFKILYMFDNILAIFISIVIYKVINEFIIFWVGDTYLFSNNIIIALIINLYIQIARGTIDRFKDGFGIYWDINAPIVESILNLFFSIILAYKYGIIGIFIGTIISNVLIVLLWKPYILFKEGFKENINKFALESISIYIRNGLAILICNYIYNNIVKKIIIKNIFLNFIVHSLAISIICGFLIIILYINKKEFRALLKILYGQVILKIRSKIFK